MIPLAIGVAILDDHTRLTHLETNAPLLAALGAAVDHHLLIVHCQTERERRRRHFLGGLK
jgi:hypothetical protein